MSLFYNTLRAARFLRVFAVKKIKRKGAKFAQRTPRRYEYGWMRFFCAPAVKNIDAKAPGSRQGRKEMSIMFQSVSSVFRR
jgi:hypothetical protein